jgi:1,5-anhydro-D-fructose reductase (1,5-anhydro-D-mannitol-forming)
MTICWGAIGCGKVAEVKSAPGLQKAEGSALRMVMRRDAALAEDYARRHGVRRWTTDADALIRDPEIDAVYIATPPGTHLDYALRVAAAGKPAYVEKPLARNHGECRRMIDAFAKADRPLFVAYYRRALPRFLKVKELVETGRIGQITMASYRYADAKWRQLDPNNLPWRFVAEHSGGGLFMDLGSHALDILDYVLGPVESVQGMAANLGSPCEVEDVVAMHCRFASGALGAATWNFAAAAREDIFEISGTLGKVAMSLFGNDPVQFTGDSGPETFDLPNPPHIQQPLIQTIVDELHGRGQCPSTGITAARTARVMDQVLNDYYGTRSDSFWTRPRSWPGRRG